MMEETKKTWNEKEPILKIENMSIRFTQYDRGMHQTELPVIRNLDVEVRQGEMVAVVGSSGSGKAFWRMGLWACCLTMRSWAEPSPIAGRN